MYFSLNFNVYTNTSFIQELSKSLASKLVLCLSSSSIIENNINKVWPELQLLQQLYIH